MISGTTKAKNVIANMIIAIAKMINVIVKTMNGITKTWV